MERDFNWKEAIPKLENQALHIQTSSNNKNIQHTPKQQQRYFSEIALSQIYGHKILLHFDTKNLRISL